MKKIFTTVVEYKNFGKCLKLSNGIIELLVTIDIGPRIISYSFIGGENILFEDIDRKGQNNGPEFDKFGGGTWYNYGGHRLWTSPEAMPRTYYPDNEPVSYEILENGARFTPSIQKWNQYGFEITVTLTPDSTEVCLIHKITNYAAWDVTLAPWALTVLSPGGLEIIPQPTKDTGLLNNRIIAVWPYADMMDDRVVWGTKYISLKQKPNHPKNFKFGINSQHGFAMYFNHNDLFVKKFFPEADGVYPDGGMSFESYVCDSFLEMETLGKLTVIPPDSSVTHTEYWSIHKEKCPKGYCEEDIDALVKKYVR